MKVDSRNIEFGYELLTAVPYACYLNSIGMLTETESAKGSSPLYFFSPKHVENDRERGWHNMAEAWDDNLPNINIHKRDFDFTQFLAPDYISHYKNDEYVYEKPIVVIANRYNVEWGEQAYNYFDLDTLGKLFDLLGDRYEIVYIATDLPKEFEDGVEYLSLGDYQFAKRKNVTIFQDTLNGRDWNTQLLKLFANTKKFITMNGGYSILASYFSGENIVYSQKCRELIFGSFWRWYSKINGVRTTHVDTYDKLLFTVKDRWIDDSVCVNILIRTSKRPNYFDMCMGYINMQSHKNVNVVVAVDDMESEGYVAKHKVMPVRVKKEERIGFQHFPFNKYLNECNKHAFDGITMALDDDDKLIDSDSLKDIVDGIKDVDMVLWRVKFGNKLIPSETVVEIERGNISGIGFATKSDKFPRWDENKGADFRAIKNLTKTVSYKWLEGVYTGLQGEVGNGQRLDLQKVGGEKIDYALKVIIGDDGIAYTQRIKLN